MLADKYIELSNAFNIDGTLISGAPYGHGHINETYLVNYENSGYKKYIFQKINTDVFKKPVELMENIVNVTEFLKKEIVKNGGDPIRETLTVIKTKKDENYYICKDGGFWRAYIFITNSMDFQIPEKKEHIYLTGRAFGAFLKKLDKYPAKNLHETIKNFHNTKDRFRNFKISLEKDVLNRAKDVTEEIDFILKREGITPVLVDMLDKKELPIRVTHNDTKLNNILFDKDSEKPVCVIDLDTVMPGLFLYDFGEGVRTSTATAKEDETDLSKVSINMDLFKSLSKGFLDEMKDVLTKNEIKFMAFSALLMTFENGIRFLTDHLDGDVYFSTSRDNHNLDRAKNQFAMVKSIEKNLDEMDEFIKNYITK